MKLTSVRTALYAFAGAAAVAAAFFAFFANIFFESSFGFSFLMLCYEDKKLNKNTTQTRMDH